MANFRYQYGDRPLDGYTIQHGVGRGGFGEVYFAVSDSGREVALKSVQSYPDIELRGIGHCMNLKSPHLISIFDVKHSVNSEPFVIMEYVNGPSLREILDEAPHGLGPVKAVYLLREIAKGLSYLHQNGVVHRDLKPHNVFIEQGLVKIGDYSLSKIMTASHRSGHTVTVGTVHYMAPEIGLGRYDHTVDIYALGVLFYEMLTGLPPFRGDSVGEVLMKHVAGELELNHVAEPYANVIRKAMAKDPRQRFQSVDEMVAAVLGSSQIHDSLAGVSADDLTLVAHRALNIQRDSRQYQRPVDQPVMGSPQFAAFREQIPVNNQPVTDGSLRRRGFVFHLGRALSAICEASGVTRKSWPNYWGPSRDPVHRSHRLFMAACAVAFFVTVPTITFGGNEEVVAALLTWIGGGTLVALVAKKIFLPALDGNSGFLYRFLFGAACSCFMLISSFILADGFRRNGDIVVVIGIACCLPMWLLDWRVMSSPIRPARLRLAPILGAGLLAFFPPAMWIVAGIATAVQLASRYDPVLSQRFGLRFPWFQHVLAAFRSLLRNKQHVVSTGSQLLDRASSAAMRANEVAARQAHNVSHQLNVAARQVRDASHQVTQAWTKAWKESESLDVEAPDSNTQRAKLAKRILVNQYSAVLADSLVVAGRSITRFAINVTSLALLAAAWLLGLAVSVGVAQAVANTLPAHDLEDIERIFGDSRWPSIVNQVALLLAAVIVVPALAMMLYGRWNKGSTHQARAVAAALMLAGGLIFIGMAFDYGAVWAEIGIYLRSGEFGYAIARLFDQDSFFTAIIWGSIMTMTGVVLLLFPAARIPISASGNKPADSVKSPENKRTEQTDVAPLEMDRPSAKDVNSTSDSDSKLVGKL